MCGYDFTKCLQTERISNKILSTSGAFHPFLLVAPAIGSKKGLFNGKLQQGVVTTIERHLSILVHYIARIPDRVVELASTPQVTV